MDVNWLGPRLTRAAALGLVMLLAGCSSGGNGASPASDSVPPSGGVGSSGAAPSPAGSRPSSPAQLAIVAPAANAVVTGPAVHVTLTLANATIVAATTTAIRPDEGHVHLYVDNNLVSMNYGLTQDLSLQAGTWVLRAEFVAADHAPFNPRVVTPDVVFTVK